MANAQMYVWFIMGGFLLMTTLFILAEKENKKLRSAMKENNEDERFSAVYRQLDTEVETINKRMETEVRALHEKMEDEVRDLQRDIADVWHNMPRATVKSK
jgi:gas vesicle protein